MIGTVLMFAINFAWETCTKSFGLCARTSAETVWNIVVYPAFMVPVYWLIMLVWPKKSARHVKNRDGAR